MKNRNKLLVGIILGFTRFSYASIPLVGVDHLGEEVVENVENDVVENIVSDYYQSGLVSLNEYELRSEKWKLGKFALGASLKTKIGIGVLNLEVKPSFKLVFKREE